MTYILDNHKVVSESEWIEARKELLKKEKELLYYVTKLVNNDEICLGFRSIKNMSLMDQMENKHYQNFLMDEAS